MPCCASASTGRKPKCPQLKTVDLSENKALGTAAGLEGIVRGVCSAHLSLEAHAGFDDK